MPSTRSSQPTLSTPTPASIPLPTAVVGTQPPHLIPVKRKADPALSLDGPSPSNSGSTSPNDDPTEDTYLGVSARPTSDPFQHELAVSTSSLPLGVTSLPPSTGLGQAYAHHYLHPTQSQPQPPLRTQSQPSPVYPNVQIRPLPTNALPPVQPQVAAAFGFPPPPPSTNLPHGIPLHSHTALPNGTSPLLNGNGSHNDVKDEDGQKDGQKERTGRACLACRKLKVGTPLLLFLVQD